MNIFGSTFQERNVNNKELSPGRMGIVCRAPCKTKATDDFLEQAYDHLMFLAEITQDKVFLDDWFKNVHFNRQIMADRQIYKKSE